MMIKACHYKGRSIYRAKSKVAYILKDKDRVQKLIDENTLLLNFTEADPTRIHRDFLTNAKHLPNRKNGTKLYHFILSFSPLDSPNITSDILLDIGKKFIELRNISSNIVLMKLHLHEKHKHIHILSSSNPVRGKKPVRFNKAQFQNLLRDMEIYQREKYSHELSHSFMHINKKEKRLHNQIRSDKNRRKEKEFQMHARTKGKVPSHKQEAKTIVDQLLSHVNRLDSFIHQLSTHEDLDLYEYRGKIKGVIFRGRKYRFRTLNVDLERIRELERIAERLRQLSLIRSNSLDRGLER